MMQQTSLLAYHEIQPSLGGRQIQVLNVIKSSKTIGITNLEISRFLNLPINSITPRTNELLHLSLVSDKSKRRDLYTKRLCIAWRSVTKSSTGNEGVSVEKSENLVTLISYGTSHI